MQAILSSIRKGNIAPIYVVFGTDAYLLNMVKNTFLQDIIPKEERSLNVTVYNLQEHLLSVGIEDAQTISFFSDKKVVLLDQAFFLTGEKVKSSLEQEVEELQSYIQSPNPDTVLVIVAPYASLDNRKKIVKLLKKEAVMIDCSPLDEKETRQFVQHTIQEKNFVVDRDALQLLLERTSCQLAIIMNELDKLMLLKINEQKITKQDVRGFVQKSLENNVFLLIDYVLQRKTQASIELFRELILQKEEPIKLIALLISHVRLLIQARILKDKSYQHAEIANYLKQHPYRVQRVLQQVQSFPLKQLMTMYQLLAQADYQLKSSDMENVLIVELAILKMTTGGL